MKKVLIALGVIFGVFALGAGMMWLSLTNNMKEIKAIDIYEIDTTTKQDQTVRGSYYYKDQIGATLDIVIENGEIKNITFVEHLAGKGTIAEVIINDIIAEQSLLVDDISGATTSSHVIKLAVQNGMEVAE